MLSDSIGFNEEYTYVMLLKFICKQNPLQIAQSGAAICFVTANSRVKKSTTKTKEEENVSFVQSRTDFNHTVY